MFNNSSIVSMRGTKGARAVSICDREGEARAPGQKRDNFTFFLSYHLVVGNQVRL